MRLIKHYEQNKKEGMPTRKNLFDLLFHLHSGKKTYIVCILSIALNYYLYRHGFSDWFFLLSTEYFVLKMAEKYAYETEGII
jgi:hypothetical protein